MTGAWPRRIVLVWSLVPAVVGSVRAADPAAFDAARRSLLERYAASVRQQDPTFAGFSAPAGRAFFLARPAAAQPATPSCSSCHTTDPRRPGQTRAGKEIAPMAVSVTPSRFTDPDKVEQWFRRNCRTVYGRPCTAREKGDYIAYMASQ